MSQILSRLFLFRGQLATLWRAFWHPATPLYLKALMLGVVIYVLSPFDILPDFFIGLGFIDDVLLTAFAVNWIVNRLPPEVFEDPHTYDREPDYTYASEPEESGGPTIDGTSRRL